MRLRQTFKELQEQVQAGSIYYAAVLINGVCPTDLVASKHLHILFQRSPLAAIQHILESFTLREKKSGYSEHWKRNVDRHPEAKISSDLQVWPTNVHAHAKSRGITSFCEIICCKLFSRNPIELNDYTTDAFWPCIYTACSTSFHHK